jgi:hypothetical protein
MDEEIGEEGPNPNEMTYEELLELEEMMGLVSIIALLCFFLTVPAKLTRASLKSSSLPFLPSDFPAHRVANSQSTCLYLLE